MKTVTVCPMGLVLFVSRPLSYSHHSIVEIVDAFITWNVTACVPYYESVAIIIEELYLIRYRCAAPNLI
jgi:hypothetical protein